MRSDLPSGTVTFLFTDIEGSTRLLREHGDAYAETLAEHRRVLREAFAARGGVEVDTQGDAFFYAFARARDAVAAAEEAQRALAGGPVRVRMGVHTGEPIVGDEGYVGMDVHRAARVMSAGHGGQVVLTQATRDLLDEAVELRDLGEHRLKDLSAPRRLFQLGNGDFPRLKTLHQTNLPVQPTPLVGRQAELVEVVGLIKEARLVTLTGAGGSGKTRLALQAAAELVDEFPQGVWWVTLAALRDPELVESTIGQVVGAADGLAEHLRGWKTLLLLDNFEQVITAAPAVAALLSQAPDIRVIATSRERLALAAEQEYSVPTLAPPEALELFTTRARQLDPGFEPNEEVAEICRRLDGLPLALELAAARIKLLSPEQILERLGHSLDLLTAGSRDAPERQRTLRATIEWSHALLGDRERRAFSRLAVFTGGSTVEAAESVCEAGVDTLQSLVDKSLLRRWASGRLGMLETVHEYARERLLAGGEAEWLRRRHACWTYDLAHAAKLTQERFADGEPLFDLIAPEHGNVRTALAWSIDACEPEFGLRLGVALEAFWYTRAPSEGAGWLSRLLDEAPDAPAVLRARGLRAYASAIGMTGDFERALEAFQQSLRLFRELGDERGAATVLVRVATELAEQGDRIEAHELAKQSIDLHRQAGNRLGEAQALHVLGRLAAAEGHRDDAFALLEQSAELAAAGGFHRQRAIAVGELAETALFFGHPAAAEAWARESLAHVSKIGDRPNTVFALAVLAGAACMSRRPGLAGRLWGAVEAEEARGDLGAWMRERGPYAAQVLRCAGPEFDRGREAARELSLDQVVREALAVD